jgi:hypothetical protein
MNYTKPEVAVLGEATTVIESQIVNKTPRNAFDGTKPSLLPAYDLDE